MVLCASTQIGPEPGSKYELLVVEKESDKTIPQGQYLCLSTFRTVVLPVDRQNGIIVFWSYTENSKSERV